jgi:hypothetical protein
MDSSSVYRRAGTVSVLPGLVLGAVLGVAGCTAGGGDSSARPSNRPSVETSRTPPSVTATREPGADTPPPTRTQEPVRTATPDQTSTSPPSAARPPSSTQPVRTATSTSQPAAVVPPTPTQEPAETTKPTTVPTTTSPRPTVSAVAASESGGMGALGWFLLIAGIVAVGIGGLIVWRNRRRSNWDANARALADDTRTAGRIGLPPVLTATSLAERGVVWPPRRADLVNLAGNWGRLAEGGPDQARRDRALQVRGLILDLVAAIDAETEALAAGRDWSLLRPRVNDAEEALFAALADQPVQGAAAEPPTSPL